MNVPIAPRYLPILKARQGELTALRNLESIEGGIGNLTPVIEVVDSPVTGQLTERQSQLRRIAAKLERAWPAGRPRAVVDTLIPEGEPEPQATYDEFEIVDPEGESILPDLFHLLRSAGMRAVPVMRLSDSAGGRRRTELRHVMAWSHEPGGCLRISTEDLDDQIVPLDRAVEDYMEEVGVSPEQVDLIIDFAAVDDDHTAAMATRLARFVVPTLDRHAWRSFTLAAGAFPVNLGEVSAYQVARIPRRDRELWLQLSQMRLRRPLDYSDYAVTHPLLQTGVAFAAPPQIRYTSRDSWLVAKGRRTDRRSHRQFFDLCGRVRTDFATEIAPASRSWGDAQFHVAADKAGTEEEQPGNASTWRAIATSHHIAHVLLNLSSRNEP